MPRLIIDLETDGLLQQCTKIHCASVVFADNSYSELFIDDGNGRIGQFLDLIDDPQVELIGHNIYNFDLKVIEKLHGWKSYKNQKITDTFLLAQVLFPDIEKDDYNNTHGAEGKVFSKRDYGSHSLKAWGQRCHMFKGEYFGGFEKYNDELGKYCIQDTYTTKALHEFLLKKLPEKLTSDVTMEIENTIAPILARQQAHGVLFDRQKAERFYSLLEGNLFELRSTLQQVFKPKFISLGEVMPKRSNKTQGIVEGRLYTKIKLEEFNPNSRTHVVKRLINEYNWNPEEFTEKGNVRMDEEIIDALPYKEMKPLKEYLQTRSLMGKLMTSRQAWIKQVDEDGRIRGAIKQNGAITGRMTHHSPNLAQIPSEKKLYGKECRELFIVPKGKVMIGCDADSLEMRIMAGYLNKLDNGQMIQSVIHGNKEQGTDPHTLNMIAFGIADRDCSKTLFYAMTYGAKNAKLGKTLLDYGIDLNQYVPHFKKNVENMIKWVEEKNIEAKAKGKEPMERTRNYWECWVAGKELFKKFGDEMPALNLLKEKIKELVEKNGYLKGLDGRKLFCRSEHGQLNTLCQAAGAIVMKKALQIADEDLQLEGLVPGKDYEFILNIHDEFQLEVTDNSDIIAKVKEILSKAIKKSGEFFKFPCPLSGNVQVGKDWGECH